MDFVTLALVFIASVSLAFAGGLLVLRTQPLDRRLGLRPEPAKESAALRDRLVEGDAAKDAFNLRRRLLAAGFTQASAPAVFNSVRVGCTVVWAVVALIVLSLPNFDYSLSQRLAMALGQAAMGWLAPAMYLDRLARRRCRIIREGFPDSLDLMQVCVEAGLGLDAAIAKVGHEIAPAHPLLAQHYQQLGQELRAGRNRDEALRAMAERMGLDEAKALATLLIQSESLGTSIADSLRIYAEDMRGRRMLAAEEKAQQLGVKLSMPLVALILPALMVVIVTPAAQKMARTLWPLMNRNL